MAKALKKMRASGSSSNVTAPNPIELAQMLADALPKEFSRPALYIFADGGCKYRRDPITKKTESTGAGGYGVCILLVEDDEDPLVSYMRGGHPDTTSNRMEMTAAITALNAVKELPELMDGTMRVHVVSDSMYLVKGMTEWLSAWKRRNFQDVKNVTYWTQMILAEASIPRVCYWHCKGHRDPEQFPAISWDRVTALGNDAADRLATLGRYELKDASK